MAILEIRQRTMAAAVSDAWAVVSRIDARRYDDHADTVVGRPSTSNAHRRRGSSVAADPNVPYRLDVMGTSVADVVTSVGGWLFDRTMAGWRVSMRTACDWDVRALQILGIGTIPLDWDLEARKAPQSQTLAVSAELYLSDARLREDIITALDGGLTELCVWGDTQQLGSVDHLEGTIHRLSAAARVFKAQALMALAVPHESVRCTESFRVARAASTLASFAPTRIDGANRGEP